MKKIIVSGVLAFLAQLVFAEEQLFFTNESLQKYTSEPTVTTREPAQGQSSSAPGADANEKPGGGSAEDRYCSKVSELKERIRASREAVEREKTTPKEEMIITKDQETIVRRPGMKMAEARVKAAERELADLEESARRKGIPPGRLRCQ